MRIAVIAHVRFPIAEPYRGGMEAHTALLSKALRGAGHEVTLFAAQGSDDPALEPICPAPYEDVLPWEQWRGSEELDAYQCTAFARAWRLIADGAFDIVHNNSLFPELISWAARQGVPMVTSQHVPPFGRMAQAVAGIAGVSHAQVTLPSASQTASWFAIPPANLAVVHNGIDCEAWRPLASARRERFVWSGRITPNKGLREAVAAVRLAGAPLDIIGPVEDAGYFARHVEPFLDDQVHYLGFLSGTALRHAVADARGALVTPMWEEPFGLVAAEALASGIPVLAFDRGAMREVIGDCGIVVPAGDIAALAAAIPAIGGISPDACRSRALRLFSVDAMIAGYEARYSAALAAAPSPGLARRPMPADCEALASSASSTRALLA